MDSELLKLRIPSYIYRVAQLLEIVVSLIVIVAITLSVWSVLLELNIMTSGPGNTDLLQTFLADVCTVVIGIEFLKMLSRHNMSSVVEVLLFAIARQMVIEHTTAVENLVMVIAISILFTIRKYLFIPGLDDKKYSPHSKKRADAEESAQEHIHS